MIDAERIKENFPIFGHHPGLVWLDNAATTQKPASVIESVAGFYREENASIHRGVYDLSVRISQKYDKVRQRIASFIGASDRKEVIFTSGTTAGINLVAQSFLTPRLLTGDEVLISAMEHHANLVPWQQACRKSGAKLKVIPVLPSGELDMEAYREMLSGRVKMVAVAHISNTLGTINPVAGITELAHQKGIPVLIDGAQAAAHYTPDLQDLRADFYVFSGHKMYGPTGTGVLFGRAEHLASMDPVTTGGDMVREVTFANTSFALPPGRFEAGSANVAGIMGLGCAVAFLQGLDQAAVRDYLQMLTTTATDRLQMVDGLEIIGTAAAKSAIISFTLKNIHPHDVATVLDSEKIAVRAGHHCTQPLMDQFGITGTTRVSFAPYNTPDDIEKLIAAVRSVRRFLL